MKRLLANGCAFFCLALSGLLYLHNYETWWARRGREAYLAFQASFFDRSIAGLHLSSRLAGAILISALLAWLIFEVISRLLLVVMPERAGRSPR